MNRTIKTTIAGIAAISLVFCGCQKKNKLYVYGWSDYISPDLIAKFEAENNCKVEISTFDCNEGMYAKLIAGATGYDIIMPTEYVMNQLVKADLIDLIDTNRLPNVLKNIDSRFASKWTLKYNVPYAFSCTGILWRKDKCPKDLEFKDWNDMFDERLSGRICMMNDIREVIGIALKMKGFSVNSTNENEISEATVLAKKWKSICSKMDNESYRSGIPAGEFYVAMSYNSDAIQLVADDDLGADLGYFVPTNGTTSSIDVLCVMKDSKNKELAHKFIDMFYDISNSVINAEYNGIPMPVNGIFERLSDKYKAIPMMKVTDDLKAKCEDIQDVGDKLHLYSDAWDKIKGK